MSALEPDQIKVLLPNILKAVNEIAEAATRPLKKRHGAVLWIVHALGEEDIDGNRCMSNKKIVDTLHEWFAQRPSTASASLRRVSRPILEKQGYADWRRVTLKATKTQANVVLPTPKAQKYLAANWKNLVAVIKDRLGRLAPEEREQFLRLLKIVVETSPS